VAIQSGVTRTSLGSLSESVRIFDPTALSTIAAELSLQLPAASPCRFGAVQQQLTAVDGSVVNTIVRVARLSWTPQGKGASVSAYRLYTQFEVLRKAGCRDGQTRPSQDVASASGNPCAERDCLHGLWPLGQPVETPRVS